MSKHVTAGVMLAGLGLIWGSGAQAEEAGWYFGISGGIATVDLPSKGDFDAVRVPELEAVITNSGFGVDSLSSSLDDSDAAWGLEIGYRFNPYVAAEVGYVNFGEALYEAIATATDGVNPPFPVESSVRFESSGPTAAVLGMLPLTERFDLHGKAGIYFADTRVRSRIREVGVDNVDHQEIDSGETEVFLGIGGAWNINDSFSVRIEYQRFLDVGDDESGESDVDLITGSILFR
jgi:OmpA-OmpF porin, OOP family